MFGGRIKTAGERVVAALRGRGPTVVAVLVAVTLLGGLIGVAVVDPDPDPASVLADVQAFVTGRDTFSFSATVRLESHEPGDDGQGAGSSIVQRLELRGAVDLPSASRYTASDGASVAETLFVDGTTYGRFAETAGALGAVKWAEIPDDRGDPGVIRPQADGADPRDVGEPQDLLRLLGALRSPAVVDGPADRPHVRATVDAPAAFGALAESIDRAVAVVAAGPDGRLDELTLQVKGDEVDLDARYRFSKWGEAIQVAAPSAAEIDPTPTVDEEGIAAFTDAPLLQPKALPVGWKLAGAGVVAAEDSAENCRQVELDFESAEANAGYLYLFLVPANCKGLKTSAEASRPFTAGRHRGFVVVEEGGVYAQITVGRTVIQADTDLGPEDLAKVLAEVIPLDLAAPPPATLSGIGKSTSA